MNNAFDPLTHPITFTNQTYRAMCFVSAGGSQVRVRVSNLYGTQAINLGTVHVALRASGANAVAGTDRALTFGGQTTISVPPGALVQSDPVALNVPAGSDLAVSVYLPDAVVVDDTSQVTSLKLAYVAAAGTGDQTAGATFPTLGTTDTSTSANGLNLARIPFVTAIDVLTTGAPPVIAALGDSITEGTYSTLDANAPWPSQLVKRFLAAGMTPLPGVIDLGIGGNRLLLDNAGPNGLARLDRDVLSQPNVTHVVTLLGINDIGVPGALSSPTQEPTAADMIQGYRQLIARAHDRGIKAIGCTLLPFKNAAAFGIPTYYTDAKGTLHDAVNNWIRTSAEFDGLIDFYAAMGSPSDPFTLNPAYDSGDRLHPNDAGYHHMAESIDLTLFNGFVTLNSVVSRKTHGAGAGVYDLPLPQGLCTSPAIECRGGGPSGGDYTLVFRFAAPVQSILGAAVAEGAGTVSSMSINPSDATQVLVSLSGVTSGQYVTVGLTNVTDALGNTSSVRAVMGVLVGDTGGNGSVNAADIAQTRSLSGQSVNASNFREDLNLDGVINAADLAFVKSRSGTGLPTPPPASASSNP